MFTRNSSEFYDRQQKFVFVHPDAEINSVTNMPENPEEYAVVDVDDLVTIGQPMDAETDTFFVFWAVLEPGEKV